MPTSTARKHIILESLHEITTAANKLWDVAADLDEMKIDPDMLNKAITALELFRDGAAAHIAEDSHVKPTPRHAAPNAPPPDQPCPVCADEGGSYGPGYSGKTVYHPCPNCEED